MKKQQTAIELIISESERSALKYGYTDEHIANTPEDYDQGDLAFAAAAYLMSERWLTKDSGYLPEMLFPWDMQYFKPSPDDRIKELVKAGSMIVKEITRLQNLDKK